MVADAGTGNYLAFADSGTMYELDPTDLDAGWWDAGTHPVMDYALDWRVFVPISTHGVVMALTWDFDLSTTLLYRHAETAPPPDPPLPPDDDTGGGSGGGESSGDDGADADEDSGEDAGDGSGEDGPGEDDGAGDESGDSGGAGEDDDAAGCSCRASDRGAATVLAALGFLALARRRLG